MVTLRLSEDRGHKNHGWLDTYHTFSFDGYHDPDHMGFRVLRVINEDRVRRGEGFPTHSHSDMEIITYVLKGALEHKDSMGHGTIIRQGEVQRMSAGSGLTHSEYNHSKQELVHLLQIWILPEERGLDPGYEQTSYTEDDKKGGLCLIASRDGRDGSLTIHQDMSLYAALIEPGEKITHSMPMDRHAWVQVTSGDIVLNDHRLSAGDGASISNEEIITLIGSDDAEILLFDLP